MHAGSGAEGFARIDLAKLVLPHKWGTVGAVALDRGAIGTDGKLQLGIFKDSDQLQ